MEERVKNLNKIVEQLQEQLKERITELEAQAQGHDDYQK